MKIIKLIASFLFIFGILALIVWSGIEAKKQTCTIASIVIHATKNSELINKSDVLNILKQNKMEWEGKKIEEIEQPVITKILEKENYIKSVDNVHFSGSKLQIEVSLYDILLVVAPQSGEKFLLDVNGIYLPYSPKTGSDVIVATGNIPRFTNTNSNVTFENKELYDLYTMALLIKNDPFYEDLFHKLYIDNKQEITIFPKDGELPVLFGNMQDAENKLKTLKYMYKEVLPYMNADKYAQLDVRFKNRIIAKKTKT
jgi:hypothetical protein